MTHSFEQLNDDTFLSHIVKLLPVMDLSYSDYGESFSFDYFRIKWKVLANWQYSQLETDFVATTVEIKKTVWYDISELSAFDFILMLRFSEQPRN